MPKREPQIADHRRENRVPFGPVKGVEWVTPHCLVRFVEKAGTKGTVGQVLTSLERWMEKAKPAVIIKPGAEVKKLLSHGSIPATYWRVGHGVHAAKCDWILVQIGKTLVTIHRNDSMEWGPAEEVNGKR